MCQNEVISRLSKKNSQALKFLNIYESQIGKEEFVKKHKM